MSDNNEYTHTLPAGTLIKDYEIESVLGKGGFGITYLARDVNLNKKVAIKELLPDGIATRGSGMSVVAQTTSQQDDFRWAVDSFLKEARILAGFDHPNIVHVYRLFEEHQTAYMVMPFIEGVSLKQVVKEKKSLPYPDVQKILSLLMEGLEVVHNANTLHRDIKPDNVIINLKGVPLLIDFGAARQQISGKTRDVTSIITPGYAPLEQYSTDSRYQGPWSDIYALAACTYFMITGKQPTPASERGDAVRNQQPDPLPKLAELAPAGFPPVFLNAIDAALQMAESMRPQSIAQWREQLAGKQASPPPMPPGQDSSPRRDDVGDLTRRTPPTSSPAPAPPSAESSDQQSGGQPGKKKKTTLVASVCTALVILLGAGGFMGWKAFSDDEPGADDSVLAKLNKVEAFLEVNKTRKAQEMLTSIGKQSIPGDQQDRYNRLAQDLKELIEEGKSTLVVSFEPSWAKTYIDGKKCGVTSGKIEVKGLGNHTLRVSADGFQSRSINFETKEVGSTVSLNKITLTPSSKSNTLARLMDDLESALDDEDYGKVATCSDQINKTSIPKHLEQRAADLLKRATKFKEDNKWLVSLKTSPSSAQIYLNGSRVYLRNGKFQGRRPGTQILKLTAEGYEDGTKSFTLDADGRPVDLGTITLSAKKEQTPTFALSKDDAINHAKNYIIQGNSTYASNSQMNYLADRVFWEDDQKNAKPKADIEREVTALFNQWTTRTYTIDHASAAAKLSDAGNSWIISIKYDFEWKDRIFTLKGKREGLFNVTNFGGKTAIAAHLNKTIGEDERTFDDKSLMAALKEFNQKRLSAGDSEGGESVLGESLYYSNNTEYYGPRFLNRAQIMQEIRESRAESGLRIYVAKSYSEFKHIVDDPGGRGKQFTFKCVTEVHKNSGKTTRTETVKVRYENGRPYVISVRY